MAGAGNYVRYQSLGAVLEADFCRLGFQPVEQVRSLNELNEKFTALSMQDEVKILADKVSANENEIKDLKEQLSNGLKAHAAELTEVKEKLAATEKELEATNKKLKEYSEAFKTTFADLHLLKDIALGVSLRFVVPPHRLTIIVVSSS